MSAKTTILAIDTATGPCSAAVWKDGAVAAYREELKPSQQSACLMLMVERALADSHITYADLTAVACTTGPGSFTGIRVGLAAARGIAFASNIPALGFTTLEVLAFANPAAPSLAILNAGKGEVYYQGFNGKALFEPSIGTLEAAKARLPDATIIGNMADSRLATFPRADLLATLAAGGAQAQPLHPFYIREPDAKPMAIKS